MMFGAHHDVWCTPHQHEEEHTQMLLNAHINSKRMGTEGFRTKVLGHDRALAAGVKPYSLPHMFLVSGFRPAASYPMNGTPHKLLMPMSSDPASPYARSCSSGPRLFAPFLRTETACTILKDRDCLHHS
eukprot:351626-Chlamydomonas_euryale.AAC.5